MQDDRPSILILITKADVGGAQVHVLEVIKQLKAAFRFILASGEAGYLTKQASTLGIETHILQYLKRPINLSLDIKGFLECVSLLQSIAPDLLHVHSSKAGVLGRLAALRCGTKTLFTAHGWAFTQGAPTLQRAYGLLAESILCRLKGSVVTISQYDFQLASRFKVGAEANRYLILNGVADQSSTVVNDEGASDAPLNIISVGRLSTVKNHGLFLRALARLSFPFSAKIIGEGQCRPALEQQIQALGLSGRVSLLGEVTDISAHLQQADLFVLSSIYEGLPLGILEAMSHGLPVIASDVGGVSEAVIDGVTGLLFAREDENGLADKMNMLAENPAQLRRLGSNGRKHYTKNFTAQRMSKQLSAVYQKLL